MSLFRKGLAVTLAALSVSVGITTTANASPKKIVGAYYGNWYSNTKPISSIPTNTPITHLFYAFSTIENGKCTMTAETAPKDFADIRDLKKRKPSLKALISLGGWGAGGFSDAALTPTTRQTLIQSCVDLFFEDGTFDGIDIDWEFPVYGGPTDITDRPEDKRNMTLLTKDFRKALGHKKLVTAALPAGRLQTDGPYDPAKSFELKELSKIMDFINVMTYDLGTGFSPVATFNAGFREVASDPMPAADRKWNNVAGAIDYYERHGVSPRKMVLGVPFYGRGFNVKTEGSQHGLYQPYDSAFWVDGYDEALKLKASQGWKEYWHPVAQSPWLYNAAEKKFVSYENPRSIKIRADYARSRGLLGTFMWELGHDDARHSLLNAMSR